MGELNLMDELSDAWDEHESGEATEVVQETEDVIQSEERTETPTISEIDSEDTDKRGADDGGRVSAEEGEANNTEAVGESAADVSVAPEAWSAEARETWKDIPKAAKDYIQKREAQMDAGIKKHAANAQRAMGMDQVLTPYRQYLEVNGGPQNALKQLLNTGVQLQMGNQAQKAQLVAGLIKNFGVDIGALDSLLVGQAPPEQTQQGTVQEQIQAALQAERQQQQGQQHQYAQQQVGNEIQQFTADPANEFYRDVRGHMASLLEGASKENRQLSLKDSYDQACWANPEVRNILMKRQSQADMGRKQSASVSIAGSPGGPGGSAKPSSIGDTIRDAWDNVGRD